MTHGVTISCAHCWYAITDNDQERRAYEQQASQDLPELAYLEESTGLQIQGRSNDIVRFTFTLVDPSDHKRAFWVDLDAGDREYTG